MMMGGLNAKRFAGKPLRQPTYSFKDIPRCARDLQGSSLQEVNEREHFNDAMAEMVLLCNETMRRLHIDRTSGKRTSKPLSLEYIADRLDVDDPVFGYFVRTDTPPADGTSDRWRQGMLQGFISVTTFTNWQRTFRWDSMHDSSFAYDDETLAEQMASGLRRYDEDGSLAQELQGTVRCGDPWNEGIVWPRIAEISLLGGMGCGKALVSLVIEKLECMKATGKRNYDYVALQATDNSIPFYESLGFVRVGCITEDEKYEEKQAKLKSGNTDDEPPVAFPVEVPESPHKSEIVSSAVDIYVTKVPGETPADIAKKLNVSVWDMIFLNHFVYKDITTRSRLMKDTNLYVPRPDRAKGDATSDANAPQWYIASENDTPKMIARQFKVSCADLVRANLERLPELQALSRLREGTRIKVSHFHIDDDKHVPYCHWTFPDDSFETNEPSYMMVRKLNRRQGALAKSRPVELSLSVSICPYTAPPAELFAAVPASPALANEATGKPSKKRSDHADEPKRPKRPLSAYMIYCSEQREILQEEMVGKPASEVMKIVSQMWRELPESEKVPYQAKHEKEQSRYKKAMEKYKKDLEAFYEAHPELKPQGEGIEAKSQTLFNKVVKLNADGLAQSGSEFDYYYVLTYIPDLKWCHLAPMVKVGVWGPDKPKAEGRPIWMLVDESEGKEVDISAAFCETVRSRAMKRTVDADNEQWDIIDDVECSSSAVAIATALPKKAGSHNAEEKKVAPIFTNRAKDGLEGQAKPGFSILESRSATKPLNGSIEPKKKRANSSGKGRISIVNKNETSSLIVAAMKGSIEGDAKGDERSGSGTKDNQWEPDRQKVPARGRGRPPRQSHSATKPLSGSIERKKKPNLASKASSAKKKEQLSSIVPARKRKVGSDTDDDEWETGSDADDDEWEPDRQKVPARGRGRPSRQSRAATKPLSGAIKRKKMSILVAKKQATSAKMKEQLSLIGSARKRRIGSDTDDEEWETGSDTEDDEWGPDRERVPARGRGRPPRHSLAATKPLTGSIEPKRRRTNPVAKGRACSTQAQEHLLSNAPTRKGRIESDVPNYGREPDKKSSARGRGGPPRQSLAATKPLTGPIEPERKRRNSVALSRHPSKSVEGDATRTSDIDERNTAAAPPTKRRKLPFRKLAPIFGSQVQRDLKADEITEASPLNTMPTKRRETPVKDVTSVFEPSRVVTISASRTVALTRSQKVALGSHILFGPRKGVRN